MRNNRANVVKNIFGYVAATVFLLTVMASTSLAQLGTPEPVIELRKMREREAQLRSLESKMNARSATIEGYAEELVAQIKQDFRRIQIIRNELLTAASADKGLEYKHVSDMSAEINKRANRLKTYLVLQNPDTEEKSPKHQPQFGDERIKEALLLLCTRIRNFVENPIFNDLQVIDLQQRAQASRDVRDIIELSAVIRKSAERLNKRLK